jgi:thiol-disulfide isomerase/thioredoxin
MGFARTTDHLLPALTAIRWISPENDYERVPEFLVEQCKKWSLRHPEHPWVTQLCEKAAPEALPVLVGGTIPNGGLPMTTGDTLNLYALLGKQLTLLDLWASWCAPCRKENREVLVPLWEEYQDQGFQIVGYALDGNEKQWKAAIRRDGADRWPQTSHLGWDDAPYLQALRIQTIPANFLVNGHGKVLAKNLHGEKLSSFIQEYFKK